MRNSLEMAGVGADVRWSGHFPVTRRVLLPILLRAQAQDGPFSLDEYHLFTVCEFWAANQFDELASFLGERPIARLVATRAALSAIGAHELAHRLASMIQQCRRTAEDHGASYTTSDWSPNRVLTDDPVDELIAKFALRCSLSRGQTALQPVDAPVH